MKILVAGLDIYSLKLRVKHPREGGGGARSQSHGESIKTVKELKIYLQISMRMTSERNFGGGATGEERRGKSIKLNR